jgi:hypothetical protein
LNPHVCAIRLGTQAPPFFDILLVDVVNWIEKVQFSYASTLTINEFNWSKELINGNR